MKPWGKTAFFDALAQMPERSELGRNPSRAIILLSDGIDNASKLTRADIEKRMEGVSIPIYAFGLREPAEQEHEEGRADQRRDVEHRPAGRARLGIRRQALRRQPARKLLQMQWMESRKYFGPNT